MTRSRTTNLRFLVAVITLIGVCGCGADLAENNGFGCPTRGRALPLTVENRGQFTVLELKAHEFFDGFDGAEDLLTGPLEIDEAVNLPAFPSDNYLSFVRERVGGGPRIVVVSPSSICIEDPYSVVVLFDDSFRFLDSRHEQNPLRPDAGFPDFGGYDASSDFGGNDMSTDFGGDFAEPDLAGESDAGTDAAGDAGVDG